MPGTSEVRVRVFNGRREQFRNDEQILITIVDGNNQILKRDFFPSGTLFKVPFYDNLGDNYTVVASRDGYQQAGFTPIACSPGMRQTVDLMLVPKDGTFNFGAARWDRLEAWDKRVHAMLASGVEADDARTRYEDLVEGKGPVLACFLNLVTAMSTIPLPNGTPLDYFRQVVWDDTLKQDRFFGWADPELYNQVLRSAKAGLFRREAGFAVFHHGATDSYKQVQFGEANVQLTFHSNNVQEIGGVKCIMIESDMDYYQDLLAHGLLEVGVNKLSNSLTNPAQVYVLRWIAGRHAGVPEFSPPYVIE